MVGPSNESAWTMRGRYGRESKALLGAALDRSHYAPLLAGRFRFRAEGTPLRTMMAGKIHRATVTQARLDYEGSITLDPLLMEGAGILPYEKVHVLDVTNGARLETYAIQGLRGSGEVCINGAAAHLVHEGDIAIILTYQDVSDEVARGMAPRHVYVDAQNRITKTSFGDGFAAQARETAGIA